MPHAHISVVCVNYAGEKFELKFLLDSARIVLLKVLEGDSELFICYL